MFGSIRAGLFANCSELIVSNTSYSISIKAANAPTYAIFLKRALCFGFLKESTHNCVRGISTILMSDLLKFLFQVES